MKTNQRMSSNEIQVNKDDQSNINTFSKLFQKNKQNQQISKSLKEKINQQQDTLDKIDDIEMEEIKVVKYRFGNSFLTISTKDAKNFVEREKNKLKGKQEVVKKQIQDSHKKMKKLKATLYNKFGDHINLQE